MSLTPPTTLPILLSRSALSNSQLTATDRLYEYNRTLLIGRMGSGKTVITLTALKDLLDDKIIKRVLIVASKTICLTVWADEAAKWAHLESMSFNKCLGAPEKRLNAVVVESDCVLINYDNLAWFFDTFGKDHNFDALVIDETTKLKSHSGVGFKKLRRHLNAFHYRVGLTGTPTSENLLNLYGQVLLLDDGDSLGTSFEHFQQTYFYPIDYEQRKWAPRVGTRQVITDLIRPLVHTLPDYRDNLPKLTIKKVYVSLPAKVKKLYAELCRELLVKIGSDVVTASNAAVLSGKLHQVAQGFLYNEDTEENWLHDEKINALKKIVRDEKRPVLVVNWYNCFIPILRRLHGFEIFNADNSEDIIKRWNAGTIQRLVIHPRSAGHGLNLAKGGCRLVWFTPYWSNDLFQQVNARLWRTGQTRPVTVYVILASDSVDEIAHARVENKELNAEDFMNHLIDHSV